MSTLPTRVRKRVSVQGNEGTIVRTKKLGKNADPLESVERFVGTDTVDPAYITIGGKLTKNLGNYESAQLTVSVTLPCEPNEPALRIARVKASSLVTEFMELEVEALSHE